MRKNPRISIIDYGVGNLRSLARAFEHCHSDIQITEDFSKVEQSDAIVLPGDGAFKTGMEGLKVRNLTKSVVNFAKENKPILGICLGAQILMTQGFEFGKFKGLNLIDGDVVKFNKNVGEKIPQIGWNGISPTKSRSWNGTILNGIKPESNVYFIHSYVIVPKNKADTLAKTKYGNQEFSSLVAKGKIFGCQFHPEKSGSVGLKIIENFIKIISHQ